MTLQIGRNICGREVLLSFFLMVYGLSGCGPSNPNQVYRSPDLRINKLSSSVYQHISFLQFESGPVPCNGMIVISDGKAVIADAPTNNEASRQLIRWITEELNSEVIAVIPTHFHDDCLGGLEAFHNRGINSFANSMTIELAAVNNLPVPKTSISENHELKFGTSMIEVVFAGEGHTRDNVIVHFPDEQVLFGGCLIKSLSAGKGNLTDANVDEWAKTVENIKKSYPDLRIIVPGHGDPGNGELLDYTQKMFSKTPFTPDIEPLQ